MNRLVFASVLSAATLLAASPALASSDYLLELDNLPGEAAVSGEVMSWSLGASNPTSIGSSGMSAGRVVSPRDPASGQASGKRSHGHPSVTASQNTQSLRESPTRASPVAVAAGDVSGDGRADLVTVARQGEVSGFTLHFDKASPVLARVCGGKHIASAQLRGRGETFVLENVLVTACAEASPAAGSAGKVSVSDLSYMGRRQTQGATFGERCRAGACTATADVSVTITGQMRHTKTGHVTLMK